MGNSKTIPSSKLQCMPCLVILTVGLLLLVVTFGWVSTVVQKVYSGAGLEYCCAIEGVRFNYIGVFVLLSAVAITLLASFLLLIRDWLIRRGFDKGDRPVAPTSADRYSSISDTNSGKSFHGAENGDGD